MLRRYRAILAMDLRNFNATVTDRRAHMQSAIDEADALIDPLEAGLDD